MTTLTRVTTNTKLKNYRFPFKTVDQLERLAEAKGINMTKVLISLIDQAERELENEVLPEAA